MPGVLAIIGVMLLVIAGLNVTTARFAPGWLGLAFLALAAFWAPIVALGG